MCPAPTKSKEEYIACVKLRLFRLWSLRCHWEPVQTTMASPVAMTDMAIAIEIEIATADVAMTIGVPLANGANSARRTGSIAIAMDVIIADAGTVREAPSWAR